MHDVGLAPPREEAHAPWALLCSTGQRMTQESTPISSLDAARQRLIEIQRQVRASGGSAVVVLHAPHVQTLTNLLREWRRAMLEERETVIEGSCERGSGVYRPLREAFSRHARVVEDLGLMDDALQMRLDRVGPHLGLPSIREPGTLAPVASREPRSGAQLRFFGELGDVATQLSERHPVSLVLHDLHRADSATRAALLHLLEHVFSDPVRGVAPTGFLPPRYRGVVVCTSTSEAEVLKLLQGRLANREDIHFLDLREVDLSAFRAFLQQERVVTSLMRRAAGSLDHLQTLLDLLPERLEDLFLQEVRKLPLPERLTIETLAVLDSPLRPDLLLRLAGIEEEPPSFSSLSERGFISRQVHRGELLVDLPSSQHRAALYLDLEPTRRARLHGRVADLLEERARLGERIDPELIAMHHVRSDGGMPARKLAIEAADRLTQAYAWERAREVLGEVLSLTESSEERALVLERLWSIAAAMNDHEEAATLAEAMLAIAPKEEQARWYRRLGEARVALGAFREAITAFDEALGWLEALSAEEGELERAALEASRAEALYGQGEYHRALELTASALVRIGEPTSTEKVRLALQLRNVEGKTRLFLGENEEALTLFQTNHRASREARLPDEEVRALFNQGTIALQRRGYEDAERIFNECLNFGEQTANPVIRAFCMLNLAVVQHRTLRYDDALESYLSALSTFRQSGNDLQFAVTAMNVGALYHTMGFLDHAEELLRRSMDVTDRRGMQYFLGRARFILGGVRLDQGAFAEAAELLSSAEEVLKQTGTATFVVRIHLAQARAAHCAGHHTLRARYLSDLEPLPEDDDAPALRTEIALWRGVFLLEDGDAEGARPLLEHALAEAESQPLPELIWLGRLHLARAALVLKDLAGARRLLQAAQDRIEHVAEAMRSPLREAYLGHPIRLQVKSELEALDTSSADETSDPAEDAATTLLREKYPAFVGSDRRLLHVLRLIDRVADSVSPVLILGESGTGKELVSAALHEASRRQRGPFIKVNCAAFVDSLLASELFGHEKGAFTGAAQRKRGRFELADGGTLFLDEIGDISQGTQVALLRVLQEGSFERVGGQDTLRVDVRLVCATNRNLEEMVRTGAFRLDLYYRLKGVVIEVPPLRERRGDIPELIEHFCARASREGRARHFTPEALHWLSRYSWPGNVRELENFVRSMLLFVDGDRITLPMVRQFADFFADGDFVDAHVVPAPPASSLTLPPGNERAPSKSPLGTPPSDSAPAAHAAPADLRSSAPPPPTAPEEHVPGFARWALQEGLGLPHLKRQLEQALIAEALRETGGNISRAAQRLEMKRPRLSQIVQADSDLRALRQSLLEADETPADGPTTDEDD